MDSIRLKLADPLVRIDLAVDSVTARAPGMGIALSGAREVQCMQLTVAELERVVGGDEQEPGEMLSIPLAGIINGAVISGALWVGLIWAVYQVLG